MANAVAEKKNAELSTDLMDDIMEFAGEGTTFDADEMLIPFVRAVQGLSPQLKKSKPEYIAGVEEGDLFNTVTGEVWKGEEGITIVPCFQTTKYLEFVPRDQGGGYKGEIDVTDPILQRTSRVGPKEILPHGNELVKSDQHFCLVLGADGAYQPAVIDMKSTQLKVSRRWKTQITMQKIKNPKTGALVTPPLFATMWKITTVEESNDQGSWFTPSVQKIGLVDSRELMMDAKKFRDSVVAGEVKAAGEAPTGGSDQQGSSKPNLDDDIPF